MSRKTDSNNPADWLWIAETDLSVVRLSAEHEVGFPACRSNFDDPDWPKLRGQVEGVAALLQTVKSRLPPQE